MLFCVGMKTGIWLSFVVALLSFRLAFAADPKEARAKEIFTVAKKHYDNKEYAEALEYFQDLYYLTENPALYLNIAQCYRLMGRYEEAVVAYRKFVEENPKTPYKETIEAKVEEMEAALQKAKDLATKEASAPVAPPTTNPAEPVTPTSQPALSAVSQWVFSEEDAKALETQMRSLEGTTQDSIEVALRRSSRVRFVLPVGLALGGTALGAGAMVLRSTIESSGVTTKGTQRTLFALALGADLAFATAGVTLYGAIRKNAKEESFFVGLHPASHGAMVSLSVQLPTNEEK